MQIRIHLLKISKNKTPEIKQLKGPIQSLKIGIYKPQNKMLW